MKKEKKRKGLLELNGDVYVFRNDHAHKKSIWAWKIHDDYDKGMVYKWLKMPRKAKILHLFDIDDPPPTAPFIPILN